MDYYLFAGRLNESGGLEQTCNRFVVLVDVAAQHALNEVASRNRIPCVTVSIQCVNDCAKGVNRSRGARES